MLFVSNIAPLCKLSRFACIRFYRLLYIPLPLSTHYIGGRRREGDVYGSGSFNTCKGKRLSHTLSLSLFPYIHFFFFLSSFAPPLSCGSFYSIEPSLRSGERVKSNGQNVYTHKSLPYPPGCAYISQREGLAAPDSRTYSRGSSPSRPTSRETHIKSSRSFRKCRSNFYFTAQIKILAKKNEIEKSI